MKLDKAYCVFFLFIFVCLLGKGQELPSRKWDIGLYNGVSMGRWIYDKGIDPQAGSFHLGYDRTHLALYIPIGVQVYYHFDSWRIGVQAGTSYLFDDELISSTSRPIVPREYFITDGSPIRFESLGLLFERVLIAKKRYSLSASLGLGTFRSFQDHQRKSFFALHTTWDLGLSSRMSVGKRCYVLVRPSFKRKHIGSKDSPFEGESHDVTSFGIDYGFGILIW